MANAAIQCVVARTARQALSSRSAGDRIIARACDHGLEARHHIGLARRIAHRTRAQVDRERRGDTGVGQQVGAQTAFEGVVAGAAHDRVVARIATQNVVTRRAGQGVSTRAAINMLEAADHVYAFARHRAGRQVHVDARGRAAQAQRVVTCATSQRVVAGATTDHIITRAAQDRIVARTAQNTLEASNCVGTDAHGIRRIERGLPIGRQVHIDRHGHTSEVEHVHTCTTVEHIVTSTTEDQVVTGITGQGVVACTTVQGVVACTAQHRVVASSATQTVVALAAQQGVVASRASQAVIAQMAIQINTRRRRVGRHHIVATATNHTLQATVSVGITRHSETRIGIGVEVRQGQVGRDTLVAQDVSAVVTEVTVSIGIRHRQDQVIAIATIDRVLANAAIQCVVAGIAGQSVIVLIAQQAVIAVTAPKGVIAKLA